MQDFFVDRKKTCGVNGKSNEVIVFKRRGKSNSRVTDNSIYDGLLQDDTQIVNGDIITESGDSYLTIARRNGYMSKIAQFEKANCLASIYTISPTYVGTQKTGDKEVLCTSNVPTFQTSVTASMHLYDAGLLSDTIKKLLMPQTTIAIDYRVKIDGKNYWVTNVDTNEYEGLYLVQVKIDNRVTK